MSDMAQTVYIQYSVDYVPMTDPAAARPVTPFFMDVTGCGTNAEFNVPGNGGANSVYTRTRNITAPWAGVAVAAGGHLHDGGIDISIKRASTGEVGCTSVAHYDVPEPMDFPSSISGCMLDHLVNAGETYTLTVRYDNSQPHTAVMGIRWRRRGRTAASIAGPSSHGRGCTMWSCAASIVNPRASA